MDGRMTLDDLAYRGDPLVAACPTAPLAVPGGWRW